MTTEDAPPSNQDRTPRRRRLLPITQSITGWVLGIGFILLGGFSLLMLAAELEDQPRTEDAYTRANIIGIAPHVSGRIMELNVQDNQPVKAGDLLFVVDPRPYEIALQEAKAQLDLVDLAIRGYEDQIKAGEAMIVAAKAKIAQDQALADYAAQYLARVEPLLGSRFVTPDQVDKARSEALALEAAVATSQAELATAQQQYQVAITNLGKVGDVNARRVAAQVEVDRAKLFLDYCYVEAPFDGYITNLNITVGEYANVGQQVFAIVDRTVWYVMANFKETYLEYLTIGDTVEIYLMSYPQYRLKGRIQGIGWAITDTEGPTLDPIPTVSPTLDWVRLAQRFPVRIVIEDHPPEVTLRMGATAMVIVLPGEDELPKARFPAIREFFTRLKLAD
ncbi:MAG: biotin/lipoyl-binding protein [Planctomycetota bacterium]|nr:biotin/lipoyl-binding protein [Planctomycetota bacterium]